MLLQAADYVQSKKHIPDLATWAQCFTIYLAVLVTMSTQKEPRRLHVFGYNSPSEQKIQMAILDYL